MQKIKICNWKWLSCFSIVSATFFWWCSHSFQESVRTFFGVCTQKKYIQNWIFLFLFIFIVFFSMRTQFMQIRVANAYRSMLLLSVICSYLIEKRYFLSKFLIGSQHTHTHTTICVWICSCSAIRWSRPKIMAKNSSHATLGNELTVSNLVYGLCVLQIYITAIWFVHSHDDDCKSQIVATKTTMIRHICGIFQWTLDTDDLRIKKSM